MNRIFTLVVVCLVFTAGNVLAQGCKQTVPESVSQFSKNSAPMSDSAEPTRAERIIKAFAAAYPLQIDTVEFRNDDWALFLRGTWYYYAEGKLLPESLLEDAESYSRYSFYRYQDELPEWKEPAPEDVARYREWDNMRSRNPPRRSTHFFDDLWRVHNRNEAYQRLQTFRFLGNNILIHYLILEELALVEEHILDAAKTDPSVQTWIRSLDTMETWSWRNIAETQSRSYHSYGLALDLLPKSLGGKETYWLWTVNSGQEWWNISYNKRYHPPAAVIKAFEKFGFVWGGKWPQYDTMHFEYRPEILIFNDMPPETRR